MEFQRTRLLIQATLFTALTAIGAFIKIPAFPVPITLQTLFVLLSGILLGQKYGAMSQLLYVTMGLAGVPVFAEGGGIAYVVKPTFGYLIGFILCAWYIGRMLHGSAPVYSLPQALKQLNKHSIFVLATHIIIGILLIFIPGVAYLYLISHFYIGSGLTFSQALIVGCFNFVIWDIVKMVIIIVVVKSLRQI